MAQEEVKQTAAPRPAASRSGRAWFYAAGLLGLALAIISIADMFSARPNDGIVPMPYSRGGIEVRAVEAGRPAQTAGIQPGDRIVGIGRRMVNTASDASEELLKHRIGESVPYLISRGGNLRTIPVTLSYVRLGGTTYLYAAGIGFLFFLIGLFVFRHRPDDRAARLFFLLCVLFLLFFVCRLRPASYWWIDVFVQNTGTVCLFLLPAVFLHFFLVFPRPKRLSFAKSDEWTGDAPPAWKVRLQEFLSASPGLFYLLYAIPPFVFLYDVLRQMRGESVSVLSGAPLSSWVLLGDYLVLGLIALAHSAFTLPDARERRQAFHVFVGTILGTAPFVFLGIVLPSAFQIDDYVFWGIVPMILIPLTFAYAIVRFQMLNIRFVVRRTFLYAATTAIVFGFYTLAIASAAKVFAGSRLSASPVFNFGFFLVAIPLFEFLRRRLQTPLDRLFFRDKLNYQTALLSMSETITGELDLGKIADYLTANVAATMRLERASLWLRDREGWLERRGRRDDRLSPEAALRRVLRQEGKPARLEDLSFHFADTESQEFRARLLEEGFALLVPLVYRERLMGILALKEKLSGERFDREDEALLTTLANQSALAIETALLHDEMTRQAEWRRDPRDRPRHPGEPAAAVRSDRARVLLPRREPAREGRRRGLLRFHPLRGSVRRLRDRRRFGEVGAGVAPDGGLEGDRVLARADHPRPGHALPGVQPAHLFDQAADVRVARLFPPRSGRDEPSLRDRGQPMPILIRSGDGGPRLLDPPEHRLPLGAFREVPYDTCELFLRRGDLIFFYTDGFSEAMDAELNAFGEERLMKSVAERRGEPLEEVARGLLADIRDHVQGADQYDDMTFLLLRVE
jgi:hypothetical protein